MLKFALCDDNENILDKLEKMLESIFTKNNFDASVVFTSSTTKTMLNFVSDNKVDVIMLDINLKSDKTGLQLAEAIRKAKANKEGSAWLEGPYPIRKVEAALFMLGAELPPVQEEIV